MRVAVTGATGFLGRRLVVELARAGHSVLAASRDKNAASTLPREAVARGAGRQLRQLAVA